MSESWYVVEGADDLEEEDVIRFDHDGQTYASYCDENGVFFATDGLCTHEKIHLADGFVMDGIIECPKHNGRFDFRTGETKGGPVCEAIKTYAVKREDGVLKIKLS